MLLFAGVMMIPNYEVLVASRDVALPSLLFWRCLAA